MWLGWLYACSAMYSPLLDVRGWAQNTPGDQVAPERLPSIRAA